MADWVQLAIIFTHMQTFFMELYIFIIKYCAIYRSIDDIIVKRSLSTYIRIDLTNYGSNY